MNSGTVRVDGVPYQYKAEAEAGVELEGLRRWWGTRVQWRPGTRGRWHHFLLVDVHPFDFDRIEVAVELWVRRARRG
jgi:hypothetical protein